MENSFRIKEEITLKESLLLSFLYLKRSGLFKRFLLIYFTIVILTIILGGLAGAEAFDLVNITATILPALLFFIIMAVLFSLVTVYSYYKNKKLLQNVFLNFNHWGVTKETAGREYSSPWRDLKDYKETKRFFLVYAKTGGVFTVQKRMFRDEQEIDAFREFLKDKFPLV